MGRKSRSLTSAAVRSSTNTVPRMRVFPKSEHDRIVAETDAIVAANRAAAKAQREAARAAKQAAKPSRTWGIGLKQPATNLPFEGTTGDPQMDQTLRDQAAAKERDRRMYGPFASGTNRGRRK